MDTGNKKAIGGLIFGIGLIALLVGTMTNLYDAKIGVLIMLAVWFIGGSLAAIALGGKKESPKSPEQPQQ